MPPRLGVDGVKDTRVFLYAGSLVQKRRRLTQKVALFVQDHAEALTTVSSGLEMLLEKVVDLWTTPDHIRHSLLSQHHCAYTDFFAI